MFIYLNDDNGYTHWLLAHQRTGYVMNFRRPGDGYHMLHRASCHTIRGVPANGDLWTEKYGKACAETVAKLTTFADEFRPDEERIRCRVCFRDA